MAKRGAWIVIVALCLLCLPLALVGCFQGRGNPYTLSPLHIPRLQHLPALATIIDENDMVDGGMTVFQAGDMPPQALLNLYSQLEVVRLDGSGERSLDSRIKCEGTLAVTTDGQWGACVGPQGSAQANTLEIFSLAAGSTQRHEFQLQGLASNRDLAWAPDGSHIAVLGWGCVVQVYTVGAGYSTVELTASFTSDVFLYDGLCRVLKLGWSPDGAYLKVAAATPQLEMASGVPGALLVDDHVAIPSSRQATSLSATIPTTQFVSTSITHPIHSAAWNPQTGALALISFDIHGSSGDTLSYYPATARQIGTWFTIPDSTHFLGRITWTPDGRQLLVLVLGPSCLDNCNGYALPDLYLYTPSPA